MKPVRYVILNPSGNLTALVTEWGGAEDEAEISLAENVFERDRRRKEIIRKKREQLKNN